MPWLIDGQTVALHTGVNGSPAQTEVDSLVIGFAGNCEVIKFLEIFAEQANSIAKATATWFRALAPEGSA